MNKMAGERGAKNVEIRESKSRLFATREDETGCLWAPPITDFQLILKVHS